MSRCALSILSVVMVLIAAPPPALAAKVLLLGDDEAEGKVEAALVQAGHSVTFGGSYYTWNGVNPSLNDFQFAVVLDGRSYGRDLLPAARTALLDFVGRGCGALFTEWTVWDIWGTSKHGELGALMPTVSPGGAYGNGSTWNLLDPAHPMVAGVPASWDDSAGFTVVAPQPGATVLVQSPQGNPLLSYSNANGGTVVHLNHDMTYTTSTIHPNALRLLTNAAAVGSCGASPPALSLLASDLPASRSVRVGNVASAFASILAVGTGTATGCSIAPVTPVPGTFTYQTTNPATNEPIGTANTPVAIESGKVQTFFFAFTPSQAFGPANVRLRYKCANTNPAPVVPGLNMLLLSASDTPVPDIVALAAASGGIMDLVDGGGTALAASEAVGAFATATVNLGAPGLITVTADDGGRGLGVALSLCQTNPQTGQCVSPIGPSVTTQINTGDTPTFAIFGSASGPVPFDPAVSRVFVYFTDQGGVTRGSTSVAVRTP